MKKIMLLLTLCLGSFSLFSCTDDSLAEVGSDYETYATDGEAGEFDPENEPPGEESVNN